MNEKKYDLPGGKTAVFYYDDNGVGRITLECLDMLMEKIQYQWIPVSESLPAYGEDVLISTGGFCNVGHIVPTNDEVQYNWYYSGWYHLPNEVDAWMPLPEAYGGDKE